MTPQDRPARPWVPRAAGLACAAVGVLDIVSGVTSGRHARLQLLNDVVPGALSSAAQAVTVVAGVLMLLLAHALRRRKRRAWRAVVALLVASVVLHVAKGLDVEEAVVALVLLVALLVYRDEFFALGDPRTRWRAGGTLAVLVTADLVIGSVVLALHGDETVGHPSLGAHVQHMFLGFVGLPGPLRFTTDRATDVVTLSLLALGLVTLVVVTSLVLRPPEPMGYLDADDERCLRDLLARQGARDSLGYFALRRDKSVLWSPSGKAAVSYRVVSGVMLASGDPLGDPEAWPGAIHRFCAEAERHAWVPAVMGCSEKGGLAWSREAGLDVLELGDEAVVEVDGFCLEGRAMRNVRQMVSRVERSGYGVCVRRVRDIGSAEMAELRGLAEEWRGGQTERGFSMALGRLGDPADGDCVLAVAVADGRPRALLHFAPWGADGLSLDLMRRDPAAEAGLNELMIVDSLRYAGTLGVRRVSLNFAVFRAALARGERLGAGPVLRLWRAMLLFASRWFQIESLYRFNAKFRPEWEPRFIAFRAAGDLPRIALAALEAEAFLQWPALRPWARSRRRAERPVTP